MILAVALTACRGGEDAGMRGLYGPLMPGMHHSELLQIAWEGLPECFIHVCSVSLLEKKVKLAHRLQRLQLS